MLTTLGQIWPGSNEGVLHILKTPALLEPSPSDCLVSYLGYLLRGGLTAQQRCSWCILQSQQHLYGHLPLITKTIQVRRTRHAGHCWRSRVKLISDILLWIPSPGRAKAEWPTRTYIQQLCANTGCSLEDLLGAMDVRDGWQERVREIHAGGMTWWWW